MGRLVSMSATDAMRESSVLDLHIDTMFPFTSLPKVRYPVIATSTYMNAAEPMLDPTTPTMLECLLAFGFIRQEKQFCLTSLVCRS